MMNNFNDECHVVKELLCTGSDHLQRILPLSYSQ